jgi:hypothetical protein
VLLEHWHPVTKEFRLINAPISAPWLDLPCPFGRPVPGTITQHMTRDDYIHQVEAVLSEHTARAANRLGAALAHMPPKAKRVEIEIFVDQDGEGFLSIRVGLVGPDLFVLNRAIADYADLFGTQMTPTGFDPALPLMPARNNSFSVHDTLTDCAASWLSLVWSQTAHAGLRLPVTVVSHDNYGTTTPFDLHGDTDAA